MRTFRSLREYTFPVFIGIGVGVAAHEAIMSRAPEEERVYETNDSKGPAYLKRDPEDAKGHYLRKIQRNLGIEQKKEDTTQTRKD